MIYLLDYHITEGPKPSPYFTYVPLCIKHVRRYTHAIMIYSIPPKSEYIFCMMLHYVHLEMHIAYICKYSTFQITIYTSDRPINDLSNYGPPLTYIPKYMQLLINLISYV